LISDVHCDLPRGVSTNNLEGDVSANADVFEDCGKLGSRLRTLPVGGDDDVAYGAGARIRRTNASLLSRRTGPHAEDHDTAHA
jgi:hypothetical protein